MATAFFPLQSNAHSLITGAPLNSVLRRLKVAALLHDEIVLEAGARDIQAGPSGNMNFWKSPGSVGTQTWQTPASRGQTMRAPFSISAKPSTAADTAFKTVVHSTTSIAWQPTFEPLKEQIPPKIDWIDFAAMELTPEAKRLADQLAREDAKNGALLAGEPGMVRNVVIAGVVKDLLLAEDWVISMDAFHANLLADRVAAGQALPVLGPTGLRVLFPNVDQLDWTEIDRLRRNRSLEAFRHHLKEVEEDARTAAVSVEGLETTIARKYEESLSKAAERIAPSLKVNAVIGAFSLIVGGVAATIDPLAGPPAGTVARLGAQQAARRLTTPRWLAFDQRLRSVTG